MARHQERPAAPVPPGSAVCPRCGRTWSLLPDGSLVEHPQPDVKDLLCPGSRTRVETKPDEGTGPRQSR